MIRQNLDLMVVGAVAVSATMYDLVLDLLAHMLHMLFELLHLAFEWVELGIEHAVEHIFHTSRHGSQIVTFYILLSVGGWLLYQLWQHAPRIGRWLKNLAMQAWLRRKIECQVYWHSLTLPDKARLLSTAIGVLFLSSYVVT